MPTMLATTRPIVWSQNTNYPGVLGLHSENSYGSVARNLSFRKKLSYEMDIMDDIHRKDLRKMERNKRKLEQSLLAYTEKMKHTNRDRISVSISRRLKDIPEVDSAKSLPSVSEGSQDTESNTTGGADTPSSLSDRGSLTRHLSPLRSRRPLRKMTFSGTDSPSGLDQFKARLRGHSYSGPRPGAAFVTQRLRRKGIVSPPNVEKLLQKDHNSVDVIVTEDRNGQIQVERKLSPGFLVLPDIGGHDDPLKPIVTITPFPDMPDEVPEERAESSISATTGVSLDSSSPRRKKSKNRKDSDEDSDSDNNEESELVKKLLEDYSSGKSPFLKNKDIQLLENASKSSLKGTDLKAMIRALKKGKGKSKDNLLSDNGADSPLTDKEMLEREKSYARYLEMHLKHMKEQERLAALHKKKLEEEKKNRKHVTESFRYSYAMGHLLNRGEQRTVSVSKDTVVKIKKDDEGREVRIMGPAVLSRMDTGDLNEMIDIHKTRRFQARVGTREGHRALPSRVHSRNAPVVPQKGKELERPNRKEMERRNLKRQISSKLILPTITENDRKSHRINIKAM